MVSKMDITILINKDNPIDKNYIPNDLYILDNNENNFHNYKDSNLKPMLSFKLKPYLDEMLLDAQKDGFKIIVDSGYRSYQYQQIVFDALVKEKGDEALKLSALPGTSEHQTGLAFDFAYLKNGLYCDDVNEETPEAKWMQNNSYKYGFILRYPKGKEKITGYKYEPWHYRFVGIELAKILYEENETLEEYYQTLTKTRKRL